MESGEIYIRLQEKIKSRDRKDKGNGKYSRSSTFTELKLLKTMKEEFERKKNVPTMSKILTLPFIGLKKKGGKWKVANTSY